MKFAGILDDGVTSGYHGPLNFFEGRRNVGQMVHHPNHGQGIEEVIDKREVIDIGYHKDIATIAP